MTLVLAIDQGTTSTRAFTVTGDGARALVHARRHRQHHPAPGHVEHDAEEILADIRACLDRAPDGLAAVGLDNQGESCLAWDAADGRPLGRVIVWQDDRTRDRTEALRADGAEPLSLERCGLPLDPYFSASKLAWMTEHLPGARDLLAAGRLRLGTTDAWFLDRLCGRFVTDITTAARTGLMNLARGAWDDDLCRLHGVPRDALPEIVATTGELGTVQAGGRAVPLTASVVDQQAALYGHGCRERGDTKITFGTGAFVLAVAGPEAPLAGEAGALPTVAWQHGGSPATYALEGGVYCASAAVDWARGLGLFHDLTEIDAFEAPPAITRGLAFVPALAGLGCPHWRRDARGAWLGLSLDTGRRDLAQSVLEGVALRTAEVVDALAAAVPVAGDISVDGGMTRNPYFCQMLATVLERRVLVSDDPELTSLGTAMLAADAVGGSIRPAGGHRVFSPAEGGAAMRAAFADAMHAVVGR